MELENFELLDNCINIEEDIEYLAIGNKKFVIVAIYRPPYGNLNKFIKKVEDITNFIEQGNKERHVILMGDFNIDMKSDNYNKMVLDSKLNAEGFKNVIDEYTRITINSKTLIDLCYTNKEIMEAGVLNYEISDHLPIYVKIRKQTNEKDNYIRCRNYCQKNQQKFTEKLNKLQWNIILKDIETDVNKAYNSFIFNFSKIYNESFEWMNIKQRRGKNIWISNKIKNMIKKKNRWYAKFNKTRNTRHWEKFRKIRNDCNGNIRISKAKKINDELQKSDIKKKWKILNNLMNKKRKNNNVIQILKIEDQEREITDKNEIINHLNKYFVDIAEDTIKKIPKNTSNKIIRIKNNNKNSIHLYDIEEEELEKIFKNIKGDKGEGADGIKPNIIKNNYEILKNPLLKIYNKIFEKGIFPTQLKIAKIIPIYKGGKKDKANNYRPISLLSIFAKIIEKIIYNRLQEFLNKYKILNKNQYGFRREGTTEKAIIKTVNNIQWELDKGKIVMGIFFDLSKAFDLIDREILIGKLYDYGIRGICGDLLKNYLSERRQFICMDKFESIILENKWGVPQGSNLGPLLYNIYVNDIFERINENDITLYADDTSLIIKGNDIDDIIENGKKTLRICEKWFNDNNLKVNGIKSKIIIFRNKNKIVDINKIQLKINGEKLEVVKEIKFLGILLEEKLGWNFHIKETVKKISINMGIVKRVGNWVSVDTLKVLYYSLIYSHLNYCINVWGRLGEVNNNLLQGIQNRFLKLIRKKQNNERNINEIAVKEKILNVKKIYEYNVGLWIYDEIKKSDENKIINIQSIEKKYDTRNNDVLMVKKIRTERGKDSLDYQGTIIWNKIPNEIRNFKNRNIFKNKYKKWLLQTQEAL